MIALHYTSGGTVQFVVNLHLVSYIEWDCVGPTRLGNVLRSKSRDDTGLARGYVPPPRKLLSGKN